MNTHSEPVTLARQAMATRFEIVLHGHNPVALRAAGEEALDEIDRVESQLSLYRNTSEIAHLNARAAREPVRVSPALFRLLEQARRLSAQTNGAFVITIAPLVRCWGFMGGTGQMPTPEAVAQARQSVGMNLVELEPENFTVRFLREGVMLDLGALGKGYAIERAAEILRQDGVNSAILHGGTSTVHAIGHPPGVAAWQVAIARPAENPPGLSGVALGPTCFPAAAAQESSTASQTNQDGRQTHSPLLAVAPLRDESLSVSAVWGRCFQSGDRAYGHVIDPRTGQPASDALLAAVILPSATETDALSTALLTLGPAGLGQIAGLRAGTRCLVLSHREGQLEAQAIGLECLRPLRPPLNEPS